MVPVTWSDLGLTGKLVFTNGGNELDRLDLSSGALTQLFHAPDNAFVTAASVSPDGQTIVMAYVAPAGGDQTAIGVPGLYTLPADGSGSPAPLLVPSNEDEGYFNPVWSPDGKYLYYGHYTHDRSNQKRPLVYDLGRMAYPDGKAETLVQDAIWPRLSADGSQMVYVYYPTGSSKTNLVISAADGTNPRALLPDNAFAAVDAPLFSRDGGIVLFSAVGPGPSASTSWLDRLLGVETAEAHNVPSDWWSIPAAGGHVHQLTSIASTGMYADLSPDGKIVAFCSSTGTYVMNLDGSRLTSLLNVFSPGSLSWIP
jgi:Tol biopolymer transport system component